MARTNTTIFETREEFENTVNQIAEHQLKIAKLTAERDEQKDCVIKKYNTQIKNLEAYSKAQQTAAMAYAEKHWSELAPSPKARSADTAQARYGFRTGQPTVKLIEKGTQCEAAQQLFDEGYPEYVETKHKLNKPAIIKAINEGIQVIKNLFTTEQTERFFVEAKAAKE